MSELTQIIGYSNFEIVRSQIAAILSDELTNQLALLNAAKPYPAEKDVEYSLSEKSIPSRIWEERFKRPCAEEYNNGVVINVLFAQAPLNDLQTVSNQTGDNTYIVEVYAGEREPNVSEPINEGDSLAAMKLERSLAQCRSIIMNPNYQTLGFPKPYFIGKVSVSNIQISQPDDGNDNSANLIYGRFTITVKMSEGVEAIQGTPGAIGQTTMKLYDTEKGYYWTNESN